MYTSGLSFPTYHGPCVQYHGDDLPLAKVGELGSLQLHQSFDLWDPPAVSHVCKADVVLHYYSPLLLRTGRNTIIRGFEALLAVFAMAMFALHCLSQSRDRVT
jgi:hypothetical protein